MNVSFDGNASSESMTLHYGALNKQQRSAHSESLSHAGMVVNQLSHILRKMFQELLSPLQTTFKSTPCSFGCQQGFHVSIIQRQRYYAKDLGSSQIRLSFKSSAWPTCA